MIWAIELEVSFQGWRAITGNPDDESERLRWLKMVIRLGSHTSIGIAAEQKMRWLVADIMSNE